MRKLLILMAVMMFMCVGCTNINEEKIKTTNVDVKRELNDEETMKIIVDLIDNDEWNVNLCNSELEYKNKMYSLFLVGNEITVIEPALIVEKVTGKVFCYYPDETISSYSNFPLAKGNELECKWEGTYERCADDYSKVVIEETEDGNIDFTIDAKNGDKSGHLKGIAKVKNNSAIFEDEDGFYLEFIMSGEELVIEEAIPNGYVEGNVTFNGTFIAK